MIVLIGGNMSEESGTSTKIEEPKKILRHSEKISKMTIVRKKIKMSGKDKIITRFEISIINP